MTGDWAATPSQQLSHLFGKRWLSNGQDQKYPRKLSNTDQSLSHGKYQPGERPRKRSDRRRSSSTVVSSRIEIVTRTVAAARIVGLICSRRPVNICHGSVCCFADPTKRTTTTSSNDVMNANKPPEITPGRIRGICTRKNVVTGFAPMLAAARVNELSNPTSVAVTVIITKGTPNTAWAKITFTYPTKDWFRPSVASSQLPSGA